jgi:hypothetical protein
MLSNTLIIKKLTPNQRISGHLIKWNQQIARGFQKIVVQNYNHI